MSQPMQQIEIEIVLHEFVRLAQKIARNEAVCALLCAIESTAKSCSVFYPDEDAAQEAP